MVLVISEVKLYKNSKRKRKKKQENTNLNKHLKKMNSYFAAEKLLKLPNKYSNRL